MFDLNLILMFYFGVENLSSWLSSWLLKYSDCVLIFATLFHCKLGLVGLVCGGKSGIRKLS